MKFVKKVNSLDEGILLLKSRGLTVPDHGYARRYLSTIGYYRLSGYFHPFYTTSNTFVAGTDFKDILDLYIFDRKLRTLVMDAMERIEVSIRSTISNELAIYYNDSHWFMNSSVFDPSYDLNKLQDSIANYSGKGNSGRRNEACSHYYKKYSYPKYPPCWMVAEVLTMGTWSNMFPHLAAGKVKKKICKRFDINSNDFGSWIHELTLIRNNCAHHARFWNTSHTPIAINVAKYTYKGIPQRTPYVKFVLVKRMTDKLFNNSTWANKLEAHLLTCPLSIQKHMGFPVNWKSFPFWQ